MGEVVKAKLFTHGGSQAVRLPKAYRFEGTEVRVRKEGDRVILESVMVDCAALWAAIDANRSGDPAGAWPDIEQLPTDTDEGPEDLTW